MNKELINRSSKIANTLQKGMDHYLENWYKLQGKDIFPIFSNEDSYRAKNIIDKIADLQCALLAIHNEAEAMRGQIWKS